MNHLALAVADQARSRQFYETWFGFVAEHEPREDGVLLLHAAGFSLALGEVDGPIELPPFLHFGTSLESPAAVRAFRDRVAAAKIEIVEWCDELDYVSVKLSDPDGYVVEVSWEPPGAERP